MMLTWRLRGQVTGMWERGGDDADLEVARAGNWDVGKGRG
jgi:hypothetical protein